MKNTTDDLPELEETEPPANNDPPHYELRLILLRILASSHARWTVCGHPPCKRARLCHGRYLTCFDEPFQVDIQRFLDWRD